MPVRVRLSQNHSPTPMTMPMPRMTRRVSVYWMPSTCRLTNLSNVPGQEMSSATPPKWASIWSARMIETAIVISAWRRSWPWFQRRNSCCISRPTPATMAIAAMAGSTHCARLTWALESPSAAAAADHVALDVQRDVAAEQEERPVGHVDHAHEPEDQREAAGHDEVQRRRRQPVEQRDEEVLRIGHRRPEAGARGDEDDPDDRKNDQREQDDPPDAPQRPLCSEIRHAARP